MEKDVDWITNKARGESGINNEFFVKKTEKTQAHGASRRGRGLVTKSLNNERSFETGGKGSDDIGNRQNGGAKPWN